MNPEPETERLCRSSMYADAGIVQHHGDREVRCGKSHGHAGTHAEYDEDGAEIAAWLPAPGPSASGQPTPASDLSLVESVARFVAEARARRWRYDETLDASTLAEWISRQATDPNTLADVAAALHAGPQHLTASLARLRSQLAEAREQRDHAQRWNDEARRAWAVDSAELAVVRGELAAAREAYQRLAEAAQTVADALEAVATGGILDSAGHLRDLLARALAATAPGTGPSAPETAEPAPERVEGSTDHLGDAEGAVAYWRAEISEILAAWLGEEQRTGWQRLASDVAEQIIRDLDIADMAAERDRLRTEAAMLRARVREWEAVNADLAERCDSGDIPTRLGERYSQAVLREIDRLRRENADLRAQLAEARADLAKLWDATGIPSDADMHLEDVADTIRRMAHDDRAIRRLLRDHGVSVGGVDPLPAIVAETLDGLRKVDTALADLRYGLVDALEMGHATDDDDIIIEARTAHDARQDLARLRTGALDLADRVTTHAKGYGEPLEDVAADFAGIAEELRALTAGSAPDSGSTHG